MRKIKITEKQNFSIHIEDKIEEDSFFFHEYEIAVKWAKEKLEDLANYIQDYTYKNKRFPDGFEKDTLINLYSEIVDLYVDDPKAETSEAQRKTYQRIVQMVKQSN